MLPRDTHVHRRLLPPVTLGLACAFLVGLAAPALAQTPAPKPLTVPELTLLLHGGYTGDEILRETAGRPLLTPLDATAEQTLRAAGADQHLLDTLRTNRRALSDAEAAAARQQQAVLADREAQTRADYASRLVEANREALVAHQAVRKQQALGQLATQLRGKLVSLRDGTLRASDDNVQDSKKLYAFYYAAGASAPCRQFTPQLVAFYQDFAPKHPAFEVVLIDLDRSAESMESFVRQAALPFPALAFDQREGQTGLMKMAQGTLPRLVLVDGEGRLVADSYEDQKYVGPQHVLDELIRLAKAGGG